MPGSRLHVGSLIEWILAAALMFAVIGAGSLALREARTVAAALPVSAEAVAPIVTPSLPPRTVFVPLLLFVDGTVVRVGDDASAVEKRLNGRATMINESIERASSGERLVRFYDRAGTRFILVLEPSGGDDQLRVAAIYIQ